MIKIMKEKKDIVCIQRYKMYGIVNNNRVMTNWAEEAQEIRQTTKVREDNPVEILWEIA